MDELLPTLESWLEAVSAIGGDARDIVVRAPATDGDIKEAESYLGFPLPPDFVEAIKIASRLEFKWFLPDDFPLPNELSQLFCGELHWGLDLIENFNEGYKGWIKECFPNRDDPYDLVWHEKFPFQEVGNGDYLAIDLGEETYGAVVYLSHDDGEGHGYRMANSFSELLNSWTRLGCAGGEDWQWLPFTNGMSTVIDPQSNTANQWIKLFDKR